MRVNVTASDPAMQDEMKDHLDTGTEEHILLHGALLLWKVSKAAAQKHAPPHADVLALHSTTELWMKIRSRTLCCSSNSAWSTTARVQIELWVELGMPIHNSFPESTSMHRDVVQETNCHYAVRVQH